MAVGFMVEPTRADVTGPSPSIVAVTPADSDLTFALREIYVGGAGNVQVKDLRGDTVLISSVPAGSRIPGWFTQIMSTNTTATLIVGWR